MADHKSSAYFNSLGAFLSLRIVIFSNLRVTGDVLGGQCEDGEGGTRYTCMPLTRNTKITSESEMLLCFQHPSPQPSLPSLSLVSPPPPCALPASWNGWHHEARVFRSRWHICFSLPHRGRERPSLCSLNRPFLGKRGECVYLSFTTLGTKKDISVYFTRAIPSLCISGPLPFERIG